MLTVCHLLTGRYHKLAKDVTYSPGPRIHVTHLSFRTRGRGRSRRVYPIARRMNYPYVRPSSSSGSSFSHRLPRSKYQPPLPQNVIRPRFELAEDTRQQVANDILEYVSKRIGGEVVSALQPTVAQLIPSKLGVDVKHRIGIEREKHGVKGTVRIAIPINLPGHPVATAIQPILGTPTIYANIECKVRLYKKTRVVQTTEVSVGYSQKPLWAEEGVSIEWHKRFKPVRANVPKTLSSVPRNI